MGALALSLAGGVGAFADPPNVGSTTTLAATTVSTPDVTPGGDVIAKPAVPVSTVPPLMVKAKSFTRTLYVQKEIHYLQHAIVQYRRLAAKWAQIRRAQVTSVQVRRLSAGGLPALKHQLLESKKWAKHQRLLTQNPPHLSDWLCIHHYEGSWTDTGSPYWGGLQMSLTFQQHYGGWLYRTKGTADHWTPLEQIWVAEKAFKTRGFWPWPNTARMCGLL